MSKNFYNRSLFFNNKWQKNITKKKLTRSFIDKTILFKSSNNTDLTRLILSSKKAASIWSNFEINKKKIILKKISNVLKENRKVIAKDMMIDTGKSYLECYQELTFCCKLWNEAIKVNKKFFENRINLNKSTTIKELKQPIGIVGLFIPYNNYMVVLSERLPFLLMSGSIAIIKPNELGVLGLIKFLDLIRLKIKKIPGIVNMIIGEKSIGIEIVKSKDVTMIDFTGSKLIGRTISIEGAKQFKRINLELGGKNPSIISYNANLKKAVVSIINDFTGNAGQNCVAISRAYIHKNIYNTFKFLLFKHLKKQNFFQKLRNKKNTAKVLNYINDNRNYFQKRLCFGKITNNYIKVKPLVFENIHNNNFLYKEELFMPILIIEKFENINEAINKANNSEYGLSATLWAKKNVDSENILSKIEAGRLWLNGSIYQNYSFLRVGGLKSSGNGRVAGADSINNYCLFKTIIMNKN